MQPITKEASSKWRALVRSGELSPASLDQLKRMDLLHTPRAIAKEVAGLNRGTEGLHRRFGMVVRPSNGQKSGAGLTLTDNPDIQSKVNEHATRVIGRIGDRLKAPNEGGTFIDRMKSRADTAKAVVGDVRELRGHFQDVKDQVLRTSAKDAVPQVSISSKDLMLLADPRGGREAAQHNIALRSLVARHEADEGRLLAGAVRRLPSSTTYGDLLPKKGGKSPIPRWSSHVGPAVPMNEAGHANFLPPGVSRAMADLRGMSGERAAMDRAAGRPLPYQQWAVRGKRQAKELQRRAAANPPGWKDRSLRDTMSVIGRVISKNRRGVDDVAPAGRPLLTKEGGLPRYLADLLRKGGGATAADGRMEAHILGRRLAANGGPSHPVGPPRFSPAWGKVGDRGRPHPLVERARDAKQRQAEIDHSSRGAGPLLSRNLRERARQGWTTGKPPEDRFEAMDMLSREGKYRHTPTYKDVMRDRLHRVKNRSAGPRPTQGGLALRRDNRISG